MVMGSPPTGSRRGTSAATLAVALSVMGSACGPAIPDRIPLELSRIEPVEAEPPERMDALTFTTPDGDTATAYLRRPAQASPGELGGVVLVAGRETGRQAARVIPGPLDVAVLAVEYPAVLPEALSLGALVERLPAIRESALRMPGILTSAAYFLAEQPEVDPTRIALVGVSFGVPFAAAAGDDPIFRGVALHHGGGDLERIFRANLPVDSDFLRTVAARFLGWYFRDLDPAVHVGDYGSTPLLLINGTRDRLVPPPSVRLLVEEAGGPVRLIWLPHDHLMPDDTLLMRELADSTLAHFPFLARGAGR